MIEALLFDNDGILVDTESRYFMATRADRCLERGHALHHHSECIISSQSLQRRACAIGYHL